MQISEKIWNFYSVAFEYLRSSVVEKNVQDQNTSTCAQFFNLAPSHFQNAYVYLR